MYASHYHIIPGQPRERLTSEAANGVKYSVPMTAGGVAQAGLLGASSWQARLALDGWTQGSGGDYAAIEPATGKELARVGRASVQGVGRATSVASAAQRGWAAASYDERAAVLRRAGDLWAQHTDEVSDWLIRESGSIRGKAAFEISAAMQECYEAAALAAAPFNAPLILSIRAVAPALALGNAV